MYYFFIIILSVFCIETNAIININTLVPLEHDIITAEYCRDKQRIFNNDNSVDLNKVLIISLQCSVDASLGLNSTTFNGVLNSYERKLLISKGYHVTKNGNEEQHIIDWSFKF